MTRQLVKPLHAVSGVTRCSVLEYPLQAVYPALALFYPRRLDAEQLASALARVLCDFPVFAGGLCMDGGELRIEHGTVGASFETAEVDSSVSALVHAGDAGRMDVLGPRLSAARIARAKEALLAVKLTQARDGSALCVSWSHCVGDMHSAMLLLRAWTRAYAGLAHDVPELVPDRDAYLLEHVPDPVATRATLRLASFRELAGYARELIRPIERIHFDFAPHSLAELQAAASKPVSINDALCTHIHGVLRQLTATSVSTNLCLTVNYRRRVGIPDHVLGNVMTLLAQPMHPGVPATESAADLRRRLERFASEHVDYHANKRVLDAHAGRFERARIASSVFLPGRRDLLVSNWHNFGVLELAFGALPLAFCCLSKLPAWCMVTHELPDARGLRVRLALPPALAQQLQSAAGRALLFRPQALASELAFAPNSPR